MAICEILSLPDGQEGTNALSAGLLARRVEASDENFIKETIRRIQDDPYARWIYLGDGGECNIKASKGDLYSQTMNPASS